MNSARRALVLSFLEKYSAVAIATVTTIILSRLLTPRDIGLYSIGAALTTVLAAFRDFGVATFLIQEPDLDSEKFRTALTISVITALTIAGVISLAGPFAAAFYKEPGVASVMHVTACSFLFTAFNSVALTWFRREMQYGVIYRMTITGAIFGATTSVTLASLGFGFMALAWAMLANVVGISLISMRYWPRQFGWRPSLVHWRAIGTFGMYSLGGNLLQQFARRCDDLIVGRILGVTLLGLFSRGAGLINLGKDATVTAAVPVAMSVFAVSNRAGENFRSAYMSGIALLTGVVWPMMAFVGLMALPIIHIMFGSQWDLAAGPAHILAISGGIASLISMHYPVYQATGALRQSVSVQMVCAPIQICSMLGAAYFGMEAAAAAIVLSTAIQFIVSQRAINRLINANFGQIAHAVRKSMYVTIVTAAGPAVALIEVPPSPGFMWQSLLIASISAALAWPIAILAFGHPLSRELRNALNHSRNWRPSSRFRIEQSGSRR